MTYCHVHGIVRAIFLTALDCPRESTLLQLYRKNRPENHEQRCTLGQFWAEKSRSKTWLTYRGRMMQ